MDRVVSQFLTELDGNDRIGGMHANLVVLVHLHTCARGVKA